jgi:GAF domain-containing protein
MPEVLKLDGPVFSADASAERTLLQQVLGTEGVSSWVSIPLRSGRRVVGLLSVSSIQPEAISPADIAFFENIGRVVEGRLAELTAWEP